MTPAAAPNPAEDDDDVDLFGSDDEEEDAEKEALTKKRLEEYAAKKAAKPKPGMFFPLLDGRGIKWRSADKRYSCQITRYFGS